MIGKRKSIPSEKGKENILQNVNIAKKTKYDEDEDEYEEVIFEKAKTPKVKSTSSSKASTESSKGKKKTKVAVAIASDDDEEEEVDDDDVEEVVEESITKKNAMKKLPPNSTVLSVWLQPNKITVNGNVVYTFSSSKAPGNVTRQSNLDGDIWKKLFILTDWPPDYAAIYERLVDIAEESDWNLGKLFRMYSPTGAMIDKNSDDAIVNNKKNQKKSLQTVQMVKTLQEWDISRHDKWIRTETGKNYHELIIVLAKHDEEILSPIALAVKGSKANSNKLTTMVKQASNSIHSYVYNYWKFGQSSKTADQVLKAIQPLSADSSAEKASALQELKAMLSVLEAEMIADQSIDVDNLKVQQCVDLIIEKLGNRNDDFFEPYELWQRRVPTSSSPVNLF